MKLARVVGTVVSTIKHPFFENKKLLLCDFVTPEGAEAGGYTIAVDAVGAGVGDLVLLLDEGTSARQILGVEGAPVRTIVAGIVDEVYVP
ncbi:MAG: EutN/CcmL family microcompartment protein [Ardenticatenales bacterium]|nr:EutN/CcmL family microcompartment protein [Ardenticatenales bacterium]